MNHRRAVRPRSIAAAVLGVIGLVASGCGEQGGQVESVPKTGAGERSGSEVHANVLADGLPRVDLEALQRLIERTAAEDRVLVLDFWATWCGVCVAIFGDMHQAVGELGEGVRLVTVTLDDSHAETLAINFLAEHGALADAYLLRPDDATRAEVARRLGERWRGLGIPAILVFDQRAELVREFIGPEVEPEAVAEYLSVVLDE